MSTEGFRSPDPLDTDPAGQYFPGDISELSDEKKIELLKSMSTKQREEFFETISSDERNSLMGLVSADYIQEHIEELPMESMVEEEIRTQIGLMIESESYQVIDPDTLAEALSKADIQPDTRDMPSEALDSSASEEHMENHSTAYDRIIEPVFLRYPQAWLLAAGFGLLMIALRLSSPIVALSGGLLLIITVLHYGR